MWNNLQRITPPAPVVTVDLMQEWLRQDLDDDVLLVQQLVEDATAFVEGPDGIGVALGEQRWRMAMDEFPPTIQVPLGPVMAVDLVSYAGADGAQQAVDPSDYTADLIGRPARIVPAAGTSWPTVRRRPGAVIVEFTAGHDKPPPDLVRAVALLAAHWYANREAVVVGTNAAAVPMAVDSILSKHRVGRFG